MHIKFDTIHPPIQEHMIVIAVEEEERATVKISQLAKSPVCTQKRTMSHELDRDFLLYLYLYLHIHIHT